MWRDWHLPRLEIAHIVGGSGRVADRRAINRLCAGCHMLNHGHSVRLNGALLPVLTLEHMLWLKERNDPENYDLEFIKSLRIKSHEPIQPMILPGWFIVQQQIVNDRRRRRR